METQTTPGRGKGKDGLDIFRREKERGIEGRYKVQWEGGGGNHVRGQYTNQQRAAFARIKDPSAAFANDRYGEGNRRNEP